MQWGKPYSIMIKFMRNYEPYSFMENHTPMSLIHLCTALNNSSFDMNKNRKEHVSSNNVAVYFTIKSERRLQVELEIEKRVMREIIVVSAVLYSFF